MVLYTVKLDFLRWTSRELPIRRFPSDVFLTLMSELCLEWLPVMEPGLVPDLTLLKLPTILSPGGVLYPLSIEFWLFRLASLDTFACFGVLVLWPIVVEVSIATVPDWSCCGACFASTSMELGGCPSSSLLVLTCLLPGQGFEDSSTAAVDSSSSSSWTAPMSSTTRPSFCCKISCVRGRWSGKGH